MQPKKKKKRLKNTTGVEGTHLLIELIFEGDLKFEGIYKVDVLLATLGATLL